MVVVLKYFVIFHKHLLLVQHSHQPSAMSQTEKREEYYLLEPVRMPWHIRKPLGNKRAVKSCGLEFIWFGLAFLILESPTALWGIDLTVPDRSWRRADKGRGSRAALPAVVQQMRGQHGDVHVLPEHGVQHGGRPVDAGGQLQEKPIRESEMQTEVRTQSCLSSAITLNTCSWTYLK